MISPNPTPLKDFLAEIIPNSKPGNPGSGGGVSVDLLQGDQEFAAGGLEVCCRGTRGLLQED